MPDDNGYPTVAELRKLKRLAGSMDHAPTNRLAEPPDYEAVMGYLTLIWWNPAWGIKRGRRLLGRRRGVGVRYRRYEVSTGGWSGNEDIIRVLERTFFWVMCWQSSRRGGHYVLDVPQK